ncbi:EamA family transporter [Amnibacterium sp.]|uniref:EamA family transporter n=1 Tax=Amnibacterium sp. TaxID=1872496 RepID=UPI002623F0BC|nr:EamA family transporter [Amnibacterium sp.]
MPESATSPASRRRRIAGVVVSASSVQVGAAFGATVFPLVGPFGVAAMRQLVSAITLLAIARPPLRRIGLRRLTPALLLGVVLVGMNTSLYAAVERIGLGLAVTIEFLGPLTVALLTRSGRGPRWRDAACGALALAGVVALTVPADPGAGGRRADPLGLVLAVGAAVLWAAYILLNQRAGALPGVTGTAVAGLTGTVLTLPFLVAILLGLPRGDLPHVLLIGGVTGVLSSALPYSLDLVILRTLPRSLFGMLQSAHPVAAAVFGLLVLGQHLDGLQVAGIVAVCAANVLAVAVHRGS